MSALPPPFGDATSRLGRSFLTTSLVPTIVFVSLTTTVVLFSFGAVRATAETLTSLSPSVQLLVALVTVSVVWFIASLVSSNWRKIVRLYEGYPFARAYRRRARKRGIDPWYYVQWIPGTAYHFAKRRSSALSQRTAYRRYPPPEFEAEVLPTTLGNILLSAERYGLVRYGVDVTLLWPRLYWQLPSEMRADLETYKEEHQLPLALSFMASVSTVIACASVVLAGGSWKLLLLVGISGMFASIGAYLLAIERAEEYAEQIRTAVDLHHGALLSTWEGPDTDERTFFQRAQSFVETGLYSASEVSPDTPGLVDPPQPLALEKAALPPRWLDATLVHLRLTVAFALGGSLLLFLGAVWLRGHEVPVVVATSETSMYSNIVDVQVVYMPPRSVPAGSLTTTRAAQGAIALKELQRGAPITSANSVRRSPAASGPVADFPVFPIGPVSDDIALGQTVTALFRNCKMAIVNAQLLSVHQSNSGSRPSTVSLALGSNQASALADCADPSVMLVRP